MRHFTFVNNRVNILQFALYCGVIYMDQTKTPTTKDYIKQNKNTKNDKSTHKTDKMKSRINCCQTLKRK